MPLIAVFMQVSYRSFNSILAADPFSYAYGGHIQ
jgi:hypothetical protein